MRHHLRTFTCVVFLCMSMFHWFYISDSVTFSRLPALRVICSHDPGRSVCGLHDSVVLRHLGVRRHAPPCGGECIYNCDALRAAASLIICIRKKEILKNKKAQYLTLVPFRGEFNEESELRVILWPHRGFRLIFLHENM